MYVACTTTALATVSVPIAERPARRANAPGDTSTSGSPLGSAGANREFVSRDLAAGTINGDHTPMDNAIALCTFGSAN